MNGLWMGLIGGGVSGMATTLGAVPILMNDSKVGRFLKNINMDFVIGLMLSAAAFSLIWPAYQKVYSSQTLVNRQYEFMLISAALLGGIFFIKSAGRFLQHILRDNKKARENKKLCCLSSL